MRRTNIVKQNLYLKISILPLALIFISLTLKFTSCPVYNTVQTFNYPSDLMKIRKNVFRHLKNTTYLDYTGAGVYMDKAFNEYASDLTESFHFDKKKEMEEVRNEVLKFVGADPKIYSCIFVQSATQALKLVGENFPWKPESKYIFTRLNHNSVVGIRKFAINNGAEFHAVNSPKDVYEFDDPDSHAKNLLAFPLEENFAGKKFDPEEVKNILQNKTLRERWFIFGDAAAYLPTNPLNLGELDYDAICMSFYKIIGYPNTGALVIKKKLLEALQKKTYLSNSVNFSSTENSKFVLNSFEDDEPPFNLNLAVKYGLRELNKIGMKNIQKHVAELTDKLYDGLSKLSHSNGVDAVRIYGNHGQGIERQGGIVAFNMMRTADKFFGYFDVVKSASESGFHLRGGCHCNPGACFENIGLQESEVRKYFDAKKTCGDENDVINDVPLGAIRASFGWASTEEDVDDFLKWLTASYVY